MAGLADDLNIIKSLIAITSGGLLLNKISREFLEINGSHLNFTKYGYNSLQAMLESSPDIVLQQSPGGILCRVNDAKMNHVTSLVNRTRKRVSKPNKNRFRPRASDFSKGRFSHQQYGYRTGGAHSPFREQRRQPFQPMNGMRRYDNGNQSMTATRAPTYSRNYCASRPPSRNAVVRPDERVQLNQGRQKEYQKNVSYHKYNSSTSSTAPLKFEEYRREDPKPRPVQFSSVSSTAKIYAKAKVNSDSDWSSDSTECNQYVKETSKSSSGGGWSSKSSATRSKCADQPQKLSSGCNWSSKPSVKMQCSAAKPIVSNLSNHSILRTAQGACVKTLDRISSSNLSVRTIEGGTSHKSKPASSSSDWSSDSGTDCRKETREIILPSGSVRSALENGNVSSTSKVQLRCKEQTGPRLQISVSKDTRFVVKDTSYGSTVDQPRLNSLPPTQHFPQCHSPPLMAGGVGRGKRWSPMLPNRSGIEETRPYQTNLNHSSAEEDGIVVTGSPYKREAWTTLKNGMSSISVKFLNEKAFNSVQNSFSTDPSYNGFQFIGDNFLLEVVDVCLGFPIQTNGFAEFYPLCRSNLTIAECKETIMKKGTSSHIVMMIGMTDILEGASFEDMKERTLSLLQTLYNKKIVLLGLPVPPYFQKSQNVRKCVVLEKFNSWLRKLTLPWIIDIEQHLCGEWSFYERIRGCAVETFSEDGCWVVMDEISEKIELAKNM